MSPKVHNLYHFMFLHNSSTVKTTQYLDQSTIKTTYFQFIESRFEDWSAIKIMYFSVTINYLNVNWILLFTLNP